MGAFDGSHAQLSEKDMFQPFEVMATQPLGEAIASGEVRGDKPVLIIVREVGVLVLLAQQMTYHHVAQGDLAGEPWLVSF